MSTAPGTRTSAVHPLRASRAPCHVLGEVFRPNVDQAESGLFVRVVFDDGGTFRVDLEDVDDYE